MKKLLLLSALLIFACSSDDDNNNDSSSFNLVGTWAGTITDSEDNSEGQVELVLNSDSTGALAIPPNLLSTFSWSSTDTQINLNYDSEPDELVILYYSVIDQDTMLVGGDDEFTTMYRQ